MEDVTFNCENDALQALHACTFHRERYATSTHLRENDNFADVNSLGRLRI